MTYNVGQLARMAPLLDRGYRFFYENTNKWYLGRISSFNDSVEGINAKLYNIDILSNGKVLKSITFPYEIIRFCLTKYFIEGLILCTSMLYILLHIL